VTAWERQETDFPSPQRSNGQDYFRRSEIMDWLDRRPVPSGRLVAGEPVGTTYGDRARKGEEAGKPPADATKHRLGTGPSYRMPTGAVDEPRPENRRIVTDLMGSLIDRVRGAASVLDYLNLLLCLHYLRGAAADRFDALAARARILNSLDDAAQLLRDVGRAADEDMRGLGVHSSMQEALGRLEPRTARDLLLVSRRLAPLPAHSNQPPDVREGVRRGWGGRLHVPPWTNELSVALIDQARIECIARIALGHPGYQCRSVGLSQTSDPLHPVEDGRSLKGDQRLQIDEATVQVKAAVT
jgi:hypothetical protein